MARSIAQVSSGRIIPDRFCSDRWSDRHLHVRLITCVLHHQWFNGMATGGSGDLGSIPGDQLWIVRLDLFPNEIPESVLVFSGASIFCYCTDRHRFHREDRRIGELVWEAWPIPFRFLLPHGRSGSKYRAGHGERHFESLGVGLQKRPGEARLPVYQHEERRSLRKDSDGR